MKNLILFGICFLILSACKKEVEPSTPNLDFEYGKNRFTTMVDGDEREYYVHVPASYDPNTSIPVVFMLHGTTGDGDRFYKISGWKELGEKENILTIYPSSWRYCIFEGDTRRNTTKWNIYPAHWAYCPNESPRDDIKFLKQIVAELSQRFNVDDKRHYLVGFSNGGAMAFRCAVEMSDVFAAIVESAGTYSQDATFVPVRKLPLTFQVGNVDSKWFSNVTPTESLDSLLSFSPTFRRIAYSNTRTFDFDTTYTLSGDPNIASIATFKGIPDIDNRQFNFILIEGLGHNYPNGTNHPLNGAALNWEWMKQYTLP